MAVKVFFHICCITRAESVVQDLVRSIHFSGLYDEAERVYCYLSGIPELIERIWFLLQTSGQKFHLQKYAAYDQSYERFTLGDIHHHVGPEDKILYLHSKGVSPYYEANPSFLPCIDDWTYLMAYFLVRHYPMCLEKLNTYDTVGVNYHAQPNPHWSGNFWWVRGDYFLSLPTEIGPAYTDPEIGFLFQNSPRFFSLYQSVEGTDHYMHRYEPFKYIDHIQYQNQAVQSSQEERPEEAHEKEHSLLPSPDGMADVQ